jgi:hypothetical protein
MVVATANKNGKPWISPVFFSYDDKYNLYWVSDKSALHSQNIRLRPESGIVIYGRVTPAEHPVAAYFDATAVELDEINEIDSAIEALAKRQQDEKFVIKSAADVTGSACWRIYKATPKEISVRDDAVDPLTGQAITIRKPVKF